MARKKGLGRGLNTLIPQNQQSLAKKIEQDDHPSRVVEVSVKEIARNPHQPRRVFDKEHLESLAASIKIHGVMQPITVTKKGPGSYELIAGERRLQASKRAGLSHVPVIVRTATEQQKLELALIENIQRHNLNPIEEALAYERLMQEFEITQEKLGERVGKKRSTVTNAMRLLSLEQEIQDAISEGKITAGHAKALLGLETSDARLTFFKKIMTLGLSVRDAEASVRKAKSDSGKKVKKDPRIIQLESDLQEKLGTRTKIKQKRNGGEIVISYFSEEDLRELMEKLNG